MDTARPRAAVFLHGLYEVHDDPFVDLFPLERAIAQAGFITKRFNWPSSFTSIQAIRDFMSARRSFSAVLAPALDTFLQQEIASRFAANDWIVVAHSAGGNLWYRWLLDAGPTFPTLPGMAFVVASPYQWVVPRITLPDGRSISVREPSFDPSAIAAVLPRKLVVIAAAHDATAPPDNTLFPASLVASGVVLQHVIAGADHRSVCTSPTTHQLVLDYLRLRNLLP